MESFILSLDCQKFKQHLIFKTNHFVHAEARTPGAVFKVIIQSQKALTALLADITLFSDCLSKAYFVLLLHLKSLKLFYLFFS